MAMPTVGTMPPRRTGRPGLLAAGSRTSGSADQPAYDGTGLWEVSDGGTAAGTSPEAPDLVAEFARLARLRDAGLLSREEFQSAQADLIR